MSPPWNRCSDRSARTSVSWTRSSAVSASRVSARAYRRKAGMAASTSLRKPLTRSSLQVRTGDPPPPLTGGVVVRCCQNTSAAALFPRRSTLPQGPVEGPGALCHRGTGVGRSSRHRSPPRTDAHQMSQPLFYFMRHGETDWNVEGRLQGQHDIPLNTVGYGQASACGEILRDLLERDGRDPA